MMPSKVLITVVLLVLTCRCEAEVRRGDCRFERAEFALLLAEDRTWFPLLVLRPDTERNSLLVAVRFRDGGGIDALRVTADGVLQAPMVVPHVPESPWPPQGYVAFYAMGPRNALHPLIATKRIRFEYLGKKSNTPFIGVAEGKWVTDSEQMFTGTRRLMYGIRPINEQEFINMRDSESTIENVVHVEPDGDRIVCQCFDERGRWIAVFSKQKLEAEQAVPPTK